MEGYTWRYTALPLAAGASSRGGPELEPRRCSQGAWESIAVLCLVSVVYEKPRTRTRVRSSRSQAKFR